MSEQREGTEPADGAELAPAARLVARAADTDRADRFAARLADVERARARRHARGRVLRLLAVVACAAVGALVVVAIAALGGGGGGSPSISQLLLGAAIGTAIGLLTPPVRERLAARRGAQAWDWHRQRHVLVGDPSSAVRDADRPATGLPPPPPPRR